MLKLFVKALWFIAALALSGAACAISMGGINVSTALGEPLNAEIQLVAAGKFDKNKMSAHLASPEAFKVAGLDYPGTLPKLKFEIEEHANGEPYIKLTSTQEVNEPFVSLLVELTWPSGQLLREYTFLLDPPGFKPEQPKMVEVQPLEPVVTATKEPKSGATKEVQTPIRAAAPMDEKTSVKKVSVPAPKPAEARNVSSGNITVKRGDTLSKIALEAKSPEISLERMMVALYRANEGAFDSNNMNRLRVGKILRVPEADDLSKVGQVDALKEVRVQAADWHAYRMKLAAASGSVAEQAPKQESSGKISVMPDKTPAVKESAKEVVRLSKGQAPGDKAATGGNAQAMQEKLHAMEEDSTARSKTVKESNARIALLEKNINEMQRLLQLKAQSLPLAKPVQSKVEGPDLSKVEKTLPSKAEEPKAKPEIKPEVKPEVKSAAESAVPAIARVAQPASAVLAPISAVPAIEHAVQSASAVNTTKPTTPKVEVPSPSLLNQLIDEPLYLAAGAAALLALGGIGFKLVRRRNGGKNKDDEGVVGTHIAEPIAPSPDTGDFTQIATTSNIVSTTNQDDVDPITEADLFLNFGRDVQAEEILKDALKNNPGNQQIRLKLLSIYVKRKDTKTFSSVAREVKDSGDAAAWSQAAAMGRKLEPNNPMYGSEDNTGAVVAAPQEESPAQPPSLDFDIGLVPTEACIAAVDVPVGRTPDSPVATSSGLDFDLNFDAPKETEPAVSEQESTALPGVPEAAATDTTSVLDFDLGFDEPKEAEAPASAPAEINYENTLVLNAPIDIGQKAEAAENSQAAQEPALDFDISAVHTGLSAQFPKNAEQTSADLDNAIFDVTATHPAQPEVIEEPAAAMTPAKTEEPLDFMLDFPVDEEQSADEKAPPAAQHEAVAKEPGILDMSDINLNLDAPVSAPAEEVKDAHWHDVATKLDLARAYQEMGDASGAREILEEVLSEGDAQQRAAAEVMLQQLSV